MPSEPPPGARAGSAGAASERGLRTVLRASGAGLVLVGLAGWLLPAESHWTALIPAGLGGALLLAGRVTIVPRKRVAAGIGAAVAVLVLVGAGSALGALPELLRGEASAPTMARAGAAAIALALLGGLAACRPWRG